jgi:protein phosphatase
MTGLVVWIAIMAVAALGAFLVVRALLPSSREGSQPPAAPEPALATATTSATNRAAMASSPLAFDDIEDTVVGRRPTDAPTGDGVAIIAPQLDESRAGPPVPIRVRVSGKSDAGRTRVRNEDRFAILDAHHLFLIADGMGGHAAGEVASQLTVDTVTKAFESGTFDGEPRTDRAPEADELARALRMANRVVHTQSKADDRQTGMGTTIVAARFLPDVQRLYVAHAGDSRCYRLRAGSFQPLTRDHTLGALGIRGPAAGRLLRAIGIEPELEVDLFTDAPEPGDYYLLCSDGLTRMVPDEIIVDVLGADSDLDATVQKLIDAANERGGKDNITVVLIAVDAA